MTAMDWLVIGLYCIGLLTVGAVFARTTRTAEGMFMAGRQSPWWLSGVSSYMTMFSAGTFVVWGGITYEYGLVGAIICSVYGIAAFVAGRFFAGAWRQTALSTAAEFIQLRFGRGAFRFYTGYRFLTLATSGLQVYALGVMLCPLMPLAEGNILRDAATGNLSLDWACVILAAIVIAYTMVGGLWAVLMTDMLQFFVLTLAVTVAVPLVIMKAGGWSQAVAAMPPGFLKPTAPGFSWAFLVGWMLVNMFQLGAEWTFIQRHLCVPTPRDARRGMYLFGVLYLFTPFLWMTPPLVYRAIHPGADPQAAYILACKEVLPAGMIGMMIAAMFSATASTISAVLNVYAGVLTDDIYRRLWRPQATESETVRAGRIATVVIGLYVLAGALVLPRLASYRDVVIVMGSVLSASLLLPTLWALRSHRVGPRVVWWTLGFGAATGVVQKYGFSQNGWFGGIPAMAGLVAFVRAHTRETDLVVGMAVPLIILAIAEWRGQPHRPEWQRLQDAIAKARASDRPQTNFSKLPAQVMAWSVGLLAVIMLVLAPFSGERWGTLVAMAGLLLALCAFFALFVAPRSARRKTAETGART